MKLALGTAQFGLQYGINNKNGIPDEKQLLDILNKAYQESIDTIDTSISYGNAEKRIAKLSLKKFKIISKTIELKSKNDLLNSFKESINNLGINRLDGYLIHNVENLLDYPELWETMISIKKQKLVKKIGVSIYTPKQLNSILKKNIIPDIIQLPYSLLDRKFEKYFSRLKKLSIEIHVRSVFLQGLYFMNPEDLSENLIPLKYYLISIQDICKKLEVLIAELALNFVYSNRLIDKIIVGVDSEEQLTLNVNMIKNWDKSKNSKMKKLVKSITVAEKKLLNPSNWF